MAEPSTSYSHDSAKWRDGESKYCPACGGKVEFEGFTHHPSVDEYRCINCDALWAFDKWTKAVRGPIG